MPDPGTTDPPERFGTTERPTSLQQFVADCRDTPTGPDLAFPGAHSQASAGPTARLPQARPHADRPSNQSKARPPRRGLHVALNILLADDGPAYADAVE